MRKTQPLSARPVAMILVALACLLPFAAQAGSVLPTPPGMVDTDLPAAQNSVSGAQQSARSSGVFLQGSGPINLMPGAFVGHDLTVQAQQKSGVMTAPAASSASAYNKSIAAERARQQGSVSTPSPFPPGWAPAIN